MKTKKPNKFEVEIKELRDQIVKLTRTCEDLDTDKQELIKRNLNLVILINHSVKQLSTLLHDITNSMPKIN